MLKSRSQWPPGGWQFRQPQTNWTVPQGLGFQQCVDAIIKHRLANRQHRLPIDQDVVAQELDSFTCSRLKNHSSWCSEQTTPANFMPPPSPRSLRVEANRSVAGGAKFFRNTSAGIKLWIDWFGDGKPVDKTLAEKRAAICTGCPMNDKNKNILEWFAGAAAQEIMAIFSALNDLDLHTTQDDKLKVCKACDCPLKAKVWAPLDIILKHIPKKSLAQLDKRCWMLNEGAES